MTTEMASKLIEILIHYRCDKEVLISKNIDMPDGFDTDGFIFMQKDGIVGMVCLGGYFPLSYMDIDIQHIIDLHTTIRGFGSRCYSRFLKDQSGNLIKLEKNNPLMTSSFEYIIIK